MGSLQRTGRATAANELRSPSSALGAGSVKALGHLRAAMWLWMRAELCAQELSISNGAQAAWEQLILRSTERTDC